MSDSFTEELSCNCISDPTDCTHRLHDLVLIYFRKRNMKKGYNNAYGPLTNFSLLNFWICYPNLLKAENKKSKMLQAKNLMINQRQFTPYKHANYLKKFAY